SPDPSLRTEVECFLGWNDREAHAFQTTLPAEDQRPRPVLRHEEGSLESKLLALFRREGQREALQPPRQQPEPGVQPGSGWIRLQVASQLSSEVHWEDTPFTGRVKESIGGVIHLFQPALYRHEQVMETDVMVGPVGGLARETRYQDASG